MKRYCITYKLHKSVKPGNVLAEMESLMQKYSARYQNCLFKAEVLLYEFEFEGKIHSNKTKNAITSICKKHPSIVPFFKHIQNNKGDGHVDEKFSISNFSEADHLLTGIIDYSIINEIVTKIPRSYSINDLELIFDGIIFSKDTNKYDPIKSISSKMDFSIGNYISYERSVYGSEHHSYIHFSSNDAGLDDIRRLFYDFAEIIPGKYEGTEIQND